MSAEDLLDVVFRPNWFKTKLKALADRLTSAGGDAATVIDAPPGRRQGQDDVPDGGSGRQA
jgi:hypothetical protein